MSCRKDTESGMGVYSLRKPKRKEIGIAAAVVLVLCLLAGTSIIIRNHQNQRKPDEKDWEQTGRKLEQDFFTIPENTKYQMEQEGYSLDDLEQAEKLSVKTGRKAIELAKAKGKHPKTGNGLMW